MLYTRNTNENNLLDFLDLNIVQYNNPNNINQTLELMYSFLERDLFTPFLIPTNYLIGFGKLPKRYSIQCYTKNICLYISPYKLDSGESETTFKFVWDNNIVDIVECFEPSFVFLPVRGQKLSFNDDNLINIECHRDFKNPLTFVFIDNYGLSQTIQLESNNFELTTNSENTFRKTNGELIFTIDKTPSHFLTIGDESLNPNLNLFLSGFVNSLQHKLVLNGKLFDCVVSNSSLTSDRYTNNLKLSSTLNIETTTLFELNKVFFESSEHLV